MIKPERAIALLTGASDPKNGAEYREAIALAVEAIRYWDTTSYAAEMLRMKSDSKK